MAGRLLIVDSVAANRVVLKVKLSAARYDVALASDLAETIAAIARDQPDLVILDAALALPDIATACARLRAASNFQRLPVILTTGLSSPVSAAAALAAGADELLCQPIEETLLMARIRSLLRMRETAEEVFRRQQTAAQLGFREAAEGFDCPPRVVVVTSGRGPRRSDGPPANLPPRTPVLDLSDALGLSNAAGQPEMIVLTLPREGTENGDLSGLSELRSRPGTRHTAILAMIPPTAPGLAARALDLGANDVAWLDAPSDEMSERIRRQVSLKRDADNLRRTIDAGLRIATMDTLTGLHNRRYADHHLARIHAEAARSGRSYAVILGDIDRFKDINDRHGHAAGDAVLVAVAERLRSALRSADMVARIGGEEFLVVLPETESDAASAIALRLADRVRRYPVGLPDGRNIAISASFGVAFSPPFEGVAGTLIRADRALYRAKSMGRDRVEIDRPRHGLPCTPPADHGLCEGDLRTDLSSRSA